MSKKVLLYSCQKKYSCTPVEKSTPVKYNRMKKLYSLLLLVCLSATAVAQQKFELGKPNNDAYRYLDNYKALKEYIDRDKYPNFKLGAGTTVNDYLNKSLIKNLINKNFNETVAGNAMKMASCVDGNGNMNFSTVTRYVNAATSAGLNVYGHTLAWHSQQPKGWLLKLMANKPDPNAEEVYAVIASKDLTKDQSVGFKSNESQYGYTIKFDATNGMKVTTTKSYGWEIQFVVWDNIPLKNNQTFKMTMTIKGSKSGKLDGHLGDWGSNNDGNSSTGASVSVPFNTEWQDVEVTVKPTMDTNFLLLHVPNYVGEVSIKSIKIEGNTRPLVPQTAKEMHDTLVYAMDKWIKGMMNACGGKVKAWDLVNEAISGGGNDGQGNYLLQHSKDYNPDGAPDATWDVGGDAFYWQDYMGSLEYVRQACRLARKYGPADIKLFINDYNLEGTWDLKTQDGITASNKLWSLVNWIKKWENDRVTKIDGIGTQMHISYNEKSSDQDALKKAITGMFKLMAKSGKLVRVSELDMGYNNASGKSVPTNSMTETQHKKMADFYEWIIKQYLTIIPPAQQWGICQWCTTDSPENSGWRANTPVGIWDLNYYRKHVYAGFVRGLNGGEPEVTGIQGVETDKAVDTSNGIYNLNGMRMSATSLDELPAGIYIVNGKKIVTK